MFLILSCQLPLPNPLKLGVQSRNEDVVGAAPTGDDPITYEWLAISLPTKVRLVLEVWRYLLFAGADFNSLRPSDAYMRR